MRRIWCFAIFMATVNFMSAQSTDEISALRFSQGTYGNSARTLGTAGAFGAVGADVSTTSINPAGLGLFRSSEISISPSFNIYSSNAHYLDGTGTGQAYNLNFGNWGYVKTFHLKDKNGPWRFVDFGINTNRMDVYNKQISFSGNNTQNSYSQTWLDQVNNANGGNGVGPRSGLPNQFYASAWMGYNAYLINPNSPTDSTHYNTIINNGHLLQQQQNTITGKLRETNITIAANYNDNVFIGASIGVPFINYTETKIYSEQNTNGSKADFNNFTLTDAVNTTGWGINAKLGTIIRVANYLRLGVSVQSPTLFKLTDTYGDSINSTVRDTIHSFTIQPGNYQYTLITPMKATLSGAFLLKGYGFISIDYTYVPYNATYYNFNYATTNSDAAYQTYINNSIKAKYTGASNIRLGTEYAYKDFRVRAGAAYYGSPYSSSSKPTGGFDQTEWLFSIGGGIRFNHVYLDIAYAYQLQNSYLQPYILNNANNNPTLNVPGAQIKSNINTVMLTLGTKF